MATVEMSCSQLTTHEMKLIACRKYLTICFVISFVNQGSKNCNIKKDMEINNENMDISISFFNIAVFAVTETENVEN